MYSLCFLIHHTFNLAAVLTCNQKKKIRIYEYKIGLPFHMIMVMGTNVFNFRIKLTVRDFRESGLTAKRLTPSQHSERLKIVRLSKLKLIARWKSQRDVGIQSSMTYNANHFHANSINDNRENYCALTTEQSALTMYTEVTRCKYYHTYIVNMFGK